MTNLQKAWAWLAVMWIGVIGLFFAQGPVLLAVFFFAFVVGVIFATAYVILAAME